MYDLANRLASTSQSGQSTTYSYDGDSNRAQQSSGGQLTKFLWDESHGLPQLAIERDGTGSLLRRYLYGASRISLSTPSATSYYHYDSLGSVGNVTSSTGTTQWTYSYEPFGTTRSQTQDDLSAPQNILKFTGELLDPEGLYYLRARQYDPASGRFLSTDPLPPAHGVPASCAYTYVGNRPTLLMDPSGLRFRPGPSASQAALGVTSPVVAVFPGGSNSDRSLAARRKPKLWDKKCGALGITGDWLRYVAEPFINYFITLRIPILMPGAIDYDGILAVSASMFRYLPDTRRVTGVAPEVGAIVRKFYFALPYAPGTRFPIDIALDVNFEKTQCNYVGRTYDTIPRLGP